MRKTPNFPGFRGEIFQFVPNRRCSSYAKIGQKIEKTVFFDKFQTAPSTFSVSLPTIMGQVRYVTSAPISLDVKLD